MLTALGAAACSGGASKPDAASSAACPPPVEATGGAGDDGTSDAAPADLAGDYTVTLTNVSNTCPGVPGWEDDQMTELEYDIRQNGAELSAAVQGNAALEVVVLTGADEFNGSIHGNSFVLTDVGPNVTTVGTCSYTVNAVVSGAVDGDAITGKVIYRPQLSADPSCNADCAPYDCEVEQDYAGTRAQD